VAAEYSQLAADQNRNGPDKNGPNNKSITLLINNHLHFRRFLMTAEQMHRNLRSGCGPSR